MRGLLVEDNRADVNLIRLALKGLASDVELHVVEDGVAALEYLRRQGDHEGAQRPDFILLDLKLPRTGGLEVLARLKQDPDLRRIPVIVLTSSRAASDVSRAYDLQAAAYFVKPVTGFEEVVDAIMTFLGAAVLPGPGLDQDSAEAVPADSGFPPITREVTERMQAEDRFHLAVESSPSAMVMIDATGAIVLVNAETERLFGYQRNELVGSPVEMLVPKRSRSQHPQLRAGFLARPERRTMGAGRELFGLRKDGSEFPVEIGLTPITTAEGTLVLSAIVDITERKRAEETLAARTRELARSNEELEQFAYVASHDLQEPLRTVASYTKILANEYADRLDEDGRTYVQFAREGAIHMQKLIEALLAFSRVGTHGREPLAVDAGGALRQALDNLRASINESGAEIVCADLPTIRADPTQMAELFQNLVGNAIKFRGARSPRVEIAARRNGSEWVFSVADNGIGIDSQFFDRIFQVFQRIHGPEAYSGTGIGLAICKRIVERMGGRIWVESTPGTSSTFFFTVPIPAAEIAPQN